MKPIAPSLVVLAAVSSLTAQSVVSPAAFTNVYAPSANTHPIGPTIVTSPSMRYMGIHDDMVGKPGVIRGLGFRLNETATSTATTLNLEARISTANSLAGTASTTFDNNHGPDKTTVISANSTFNFGVFTAPLPGPAPFVFQFPFTTLFPFAGSAGIAWELIIASRTNTAAFSLDASSSSVFNLVGASLGTGCIASGNTSAATASSAYASGTLTLSGASLTASAPGALVLGTSQTSWGGIPLPFVLPGTTGYPSGTCTVYSDYLIDLPQISTSSGGLSQAFPLALGPSTLGGVLYHYGFTLDTAANGFGLVLSNSRFTGFGNGLVPGLGCRIYAFNNSAATTGTKDSTTVVTMFQY